MYWESKQHKFSCICAIAISILMILGIISSSILIIIISYICGCLSYFFYKKFKNDVLSNYEIINQSEQQYIEQKGIVFEKNNTVLNQSSEMVTTNIEQVIDRKIAKGFLYDFKKSKLQVKGHVEQKIWSQLGDIEELITILLEKVNKKNMILQEKNIDKMVYKYLIPALQNYIQLPIFLRERSFLEGNTTPSHLLEKQLDLIQKELEEIVQLIYQNDLNHLHDHAEFLRQKLEREELFKLNPSKK